jgi:hypothetical protein
MERGTRSLSSQFAISKQGGNLTDLEVGLSLHRSLIEYQFEGVLRDASEALPRTELPGVRAYVAFAFLEKTHQ